MKMKKKEKLFITIGIAAILLVTAGIYINYRLDALVASLQNPGILFADLEITPLETDPNNPGQTSTGDTYTNPSGTYNRNPEFNAPENLPINPGLPNGNNGQNARDIASGVQQKVNKPIEKADLIKAGLIIIRKLNSEEISYLYNVGTKDSYTTEELAKTREILLTKLTQEDIETLRQLGGKYDKPLKVLDPTVPLK